METISVPKKKLNLYATAGASFFLSVGLILFFTLLVGYVFVLFPKKIIGFGLEAVLIFFILAGILRSLAIILLEGLAGWRQGLKVLIFDFLYIFFQPKLWKLGLVSFYFPYHLARWEAERLDLSKKGLTKKDLIYGETPYFSVAKIIREIRPGGGEDLLVDLGCGIGKVIFFAALKFNLPSLGIEINPALFKAAQEIKEKLNIKKAVFIGGNVLDEDFSSGTIFYLHGTSWSEAVYQKLTQKFEEVRTGALILSVSHRVEAPFLIFVKEIKIDLNWGAEPLYIYQRM